MDLIAKGLGRLAIVAGAGLLLFLAFVIVNAAVGAVTASGNPDPDQAARGVAQQLFNQGKATFRFDTFGDEAFWGGALQLHRAIEGAKLGGVGPGVSPKTALQVGLEVDSQALPQSLKQALSAGKVDLDDPATTLALLKLNAVVGLRGFFNGQGTLQSVGITCAVCHSIVDDSFAPGIGRRLDGRPNRDLNVGTIVSLAPNKKPLTDLLGVDVATVDKVLAAWGPGKFDAELFLDGKGFRPDGKTAAVLIPPAFGLAGVNLHTYTGWGSVPYWNAFVANLEMHGKGNFVDPRLNDAARFPIAAAAGFARVRNTPDLITPKLAALHVYQLGLKAPTPPRGSFDPAAAQRGKAIFNGIGKCANCHMPRFSPSPARTCTDRRRSARTPSRQTAPRPGCTARPRSRGSSPMPSTVSGTTDASRTRRPSWSTTTAASASG